MIEFALHVIGTLTVMEIIHIKIWQCVVQITMHTAVCAYIVLKNKSMYEASCEGNDKGLKCTSIKS